MEKASLLNADYLDIIFDQRNKNYGAYQLRKHYNRRLIKSLLLLLSGIGGLIGLSFVTVHSKVAVKPYERKDTLKIALVAHLNIIPPKMTRPVMPSQPAAHIKLHITTPPVITEDPIKPEQQMLAATTTTDAMPGDSKIAGDGHDIPSGSGGGTSAIVAPTEKTFVKPFVYVEQMPQFAGDITSYILSHLHYPEAARDAGMEGTVVIRFVVNEDGSVSDATVMRSAGSGCDEEALRVVMGMPKWKPGRQNGVPVKVYFTIPISFKLK